MLCFSFLTTFYFSDFKNLQEMNQQVSLDGERSPSPPPPMSPLNPPRERRIFLILVMKHTQLIPPHHRIDRVRPIMCQLFSNFGLYVEGGEGNGLYSFLICN